jgi:hypothetical protein
MKRTKLSLAVFVAISALSRIDAAPLEEFLKSVDVSGFERMKYNISKKDNATATENIRLSSQLNLISNVYENLYFGTTLAADGHNYPHSEPSAPIAGYNPATNKGVYVDRFYFRYIADGFTLTGGKQDVTTPWTETGFNSSRGNGLSALYSGIENWTFAAATFLQTNGFDDTNHGSDLGSHHNYYALGATGKFEDIGLDLQLWGGVYENIMDTMIYADAKYSFNGFRIRGQINYAKLDKDFADKLAFTDNDGIYYGVELRYTHEAFWVRAMYSKNDKKQPIYVFDGDNIEFIKAGGDLYYTATNLANAAVYYVGIGKNFDKFRVKGGYGIVDDGDKKDGEAEIGFGYRLKNFDASLTFGYVDKDTGADTKKSGIEIIYKF